VPTAVESHSEMLHYLCVEAALLLSSIWALAIY